MRGISQLSKAKAQLQQKVNKLEDGESGSNCTCIMILYRLDDGPGGRILTDAGVWFVSCMLADDGYFDWTCTELPGELETSSTDACDV
jgi:hypothetical protein